MYKSFGYRRLSIILVQIKRLTIVYIESKSEKMISIEGVVTIAEGLKKSKLNSGEGAHIL